MELLRQLRSLTQIQSRGSTSRGKWNLFSGSPPASGERLEGIWEQALPWILLEIKPGLKGNGNNLDRS